MTNSQDTPAEVLVRFVKGQASETELRDAERRGVAAARAELSSLEDHKIPPLSERAQLHS